MVVVLCRKESDNDRNCRLLHHAMRQVEVKPQGKAKGKLAMRQSGGKSE